MCIRDRDGITYLINNVTAGIKTPLTEDYKTEILRLMETEDLTGALKKARQE